MPQRPSIHRPAGWAPWAQRNAAHIREKRQRDNKTYDGTWRKLRAQFIAHNPGCCQPGCDKPATDVEHKISVRERPDLRLEWSNLRAFCHSHHSARTARDQGFAQSGPR